MSVQQLLELVHRCLALPGAEALASQLMEGLLSLHPARFFAACLQLALASGRTEARADALRMLCRVPTDLLPAAVLADALAQVAEGVDADQLAPPFMPYEFIARLYSAPAVQNSLNSALADGLFVPPEEHASVDELWTVRVSSAAQAPAPAYDGEGSSAAQGSSAAATAAPPRAASPVMLLPVAASHLALGELAERLVGAVLSALLRRLGASLDAEGMCEELVQLTQLLLGPLAQQGPWALEYAWRRLYRQQVQPFLAAAASGGASGAAPIFLQFWSSLPWYQATFHAADPLRLAELRAYQLGAPDGAATELLGSLDFKLVLAKVRAWRGRAKGEGRAIVPGEQCTR